MAGPDRRTPPARNAALVVVALLVLGVAFAGGRLSGGSRTTGGPRPSASPTASPSPVVVRSLVRPFVDGHLTFSVLAFGCGLTYVQGTHASEGQPEGQYCHAGLRVDNHDPAYHTFVLTGQRIEGVPGDRGRPDPFAMAVRRQPDEIRIGGHDAIEVELWFDVPKAARVTGLRLSGDRDPIGFRGEGVAPHVPGGRVVRLRPADEAPG